jgi:NAD(P)-dependent dehydrogenase (short-subunit alcohol dehydrogenase family)
VNKIDQLHHGRVWLPHDFGRSFHCTCVSYQESNRYVFVAFYLCQNLRQYIVLITGVTLGGLGQETARAIAIHAPKLIILAGRTVSKVQDAQDAIKKAAPDTPTRQLILDLASQKKVREAAKEVNSWTDVPTIDIVINNAGIMAQPFQLNEDGIESQFGANHIGHFLFTQLIIGKILASGDGARVVNLSSNGYQMGGVRWNDWNFEVRRQNSERDKIEI